MKKDINDALFLEILSDFYVFGTFLVITNHTKKDYMAVIDYLFDNGYVNERGERISHYNSYYNVINGNLSQKGKEMYYMLVSLSVL